MRNYYVVLGVPSSETAAGIRAAFRDLAKRHHPDRVGPDGEARFREIVEAYEVLSDPERRREYNHRLHDERPPRRVTQSGWPPVEPLAAAPQSIFDPPEALRPSYAEMYERVRRNFTSAAVPKAEHAEALEVDAVLSPEELASGAVLRLGIPIFRRCPECGGTGRDWLFPCFRCGQQGWIEATQPLRVRVPPLVRPGLVLDVPLDDFGIGNFVLRLRIR